MSVSTQLCLASAHSSTLHPALPLASCPGGLIPETCGPRPISPPAHGRHQQEQGVWEEGTRSVFPSPAQLWLAVGGTSPTSAFLTSLQHSLGWLPTVASPGTGCPCPVLTDILVKSWIKLSSVPLGLCRPLLPRPGILEQ